MEQQYIAQTKDDAVSPLWFTLPTQEQIEKARAIQTVGDLLDFIENNKKLFCVNGRLEAKSYFSRYDRDMKIDDIKRIPQRFVFDWCMTFRTDTDIIIRFRSRIRTRRWIELWNFHFPDYRIKQNDGA